MRVCWVVPVDSGHRTDGGRALRDGEGVGRSWLKSVVLSVGILSSTPLHINSRHLPGNKPNKPPRLANHGIVLDVTTWFILMTFGNQLCCRSRQVVAWLFMTSNIMK